MITSFTSLPRLYEVQGELVWTTSWLNRLWVRFCGGSEVTSASVPRLSQKVQDLIARTPLAVSKQLSLIQLLKGRASPLLHTGHLQPLPPQADHPFDFRQEMVDCLRSIDELPKDDSDESERKMEQKRQQVQDLLALFLEYEGEREREVSLLHMERRQEEETIDVTLGRETLRSGERVVPTSAELKEKKQFLLSQLKKAFPEAQDREEGLHSLLFGNAVDATHEEDSLRNLEAKVFRSLFVGGARSSIPNGLWLENTLDGLPSEVHTSLGQVEMSVPYIHKAKEGHEDYYYVFTQKSVLTKTDQGKWQTKVYMSWERKEKIPFLFQAIQSAQACGKSGKALRTELEAELTSVLLRKAALGEIPSCIERHPELASFLSPMPKEEAPFLQGLVSRLVR